MVTGRQQLVLIHGLPEPIQEMSKDLRWDRKRFAGLGARSLKRQEKNAPCQTYMDFPVAPPHDPQQARTSH